MSGITYRLARQAAALDIAGAPIAVLHRQRDPPGQPEQRGRPPGQHRGGRAARARGPGPAQPAPRGNENRPTQMTPVMDAMAGIAYDYGVAVLAIHHLSKPSAERRGDIWDRYRGASWIRSGTDANLALDGSGDRVRLRCKYRCRATVRVPRARPQHAAIRAGRRPGGADQGGRPRAAPVRPGADAGHGGTGHGRVRRVEDDRPSSPSSPRL